ncbi:polysaccharide deacetylase family protein [Niabella terrae]
MYFVKTPQWLKRVFKWYHWDIPTDTKILYLSFDDGPHPQITPFVLEMLERFQAKASFFCIGKNVQAHPEIYLQILAGGHTTGNHTHNHLNGWKAPIPAYISNVNQAAGLIDSKLFRPPYGRITRKKAELLIAQGFEIIMWDVLSADFDTHISPEKCFENVRKGCRPGSIIVFHDSEKAYQNMAYALPRTLQYFSEQGYQFHALPVDFQGAEKKKGPG